MSHQMPYPDLVAWMNHLRQYPVYVRLPLVPASSNIMKIYVTQVLLDSYTLLKPETYRSQWKKLEQLDVTAPIASNVNLYSTSLRNLT